MELLTFCMIWVRMRVVNAKDDQIRGALILDEIPLVVRTEI
jgi:hypothetical protein